MVWRVERYHYTAAAQLCQPMITTVGLIFFPSLLLSLTPRLSNGFSGDLHVGDQTSSLKGVLPIKGRISQEREGRERERERERELGHQMLDII